MRKVAFFLLLGIVLAQFSAPNFQERRVYYDEEENICEQGSGHDWVTLDISADGEHVKEVMVKTYNYCDQWESNKGKGIRIAPKWSYEDETNDLKFQEEATPYYYDGELVGIIVKSTLRPSAKVEGKQYDCVINGNGKLLHYGGGKGSKH